MGGRSTAVAGDSKLRRAFFTVRFWPEADTRPGYAEQMKQRELEIDGLRWTCVQAMAAVTGAAAEAAERKLESSGSVPVVCTPSGEAQSVRLTLATDWLDAIDDEQLAGEITKAQGR
jgi:hypothetical protein